MPEYLPVPVEYLVLSLGVLLYVADLAWPVLANEVLFVGTAGDSWSARFPADGIRLQRRAFVLPRPLAPATFVVRAQWPAPPAGGEAEADAALPGLHALARDLRVPGLVCTLLLAQLFLGLPLAYVQKANALPTLGLLLLIYLQVICLVVWLFLRHRHFGIGRGAAALIAIECLVCLPCAINFCRKVAARAGRRAPREVRVLAAGLLPPAAIGEFRLRLRSVVDGLVDRQQAAGAASERLLEFRDELEASRDVAG